MEAEARPHLAGQILPIDPRRFEHGEGADKIAVYELVGPVDRTVHMRLGCEMHDSVGLVLGEDARHGGAVSDIGDFERVVRGRRQRAERRIRAGISQLVEIDDAVAGRKQMPHDRSADEAGAAADQDLQAVFSPSASASTSASRGITQTPSFFAGAAAESFNNTKVATPASRQATMSRVSSPIPHERDRSRPSSCWAARIMPGCGL